MNRFEIGDKVQIVNIPAASPDAVNNLTLAEVQAVPGWNRFFPDAYGIVLHDGSMRPALEKYLRPDQAPPKNRGSLDVKSSWGEFESVTGTSSAMIRSGNRNPDY